jgi:hypothetical protein
VLVWGNPGEAQKEIRAIVAPAPLQEGQPAHGHGQARLRSARAAVRKQDVTTTREDASDQHDEGDRRAIRELIENWAVWRDAGDWERFRSVWHD